MAASDQKFVCDIYQDSEMMQMIGPAFTYQQAVQLFNNALNDVDDNKAWYFIVENKETATDLAFVGMQLQLSNPKSLEVGSMILKPHRSQGIAAWVQQQAFKLGQLNHGINRYVVYCAASHHAANKCYARMGFKLTPNNSQKKHHQGMNCWQLILQVKT